LQGCAAGVRLQSMISLAPSVGAIMIAGVLGGAAELGVLILAPYLPYPHISLEGASDHA